MASRVCPARGSTVRLEPALATGSAPMGPLAAGTAHAIWAGGPRSAPSNVLVKAHAPGTERVTILPTAPARPTTTGTIAQRHARGLRQTDQQPAPHTARALMAPMGRGCAPASMATGVLVARTSATAVRRPLARDTAPAPPAEKGPGCAPVPTAGSVSIAVVSAWVVQPLPATAMASATAGEGAVDSALALGRLRVGSGTARSALPAWVDGIPRTVHSCANCAADGAHARTGGTTTGRVCATPVPGGTAVRRTAPGGRTMCARDTAPATKGPAARAAAHAA